MKTILAALLACLLIGTADAQQRDSITFEQYNELCRQYRESVDRKLERKECTPKEHIDYVVKIPQYVIEDHGPLFKRVILTPGRITAYRATKTEADYVIDAIEENTRAIQQAQRNCRGHR